MSFLYNEELEREADVARSRFAGSNDVIGDMSRAYAVDFYKVNIHHDAHADSVACSYGCDAVAGKNDIYFRQGAYDMSRQENRGLLAHELHHTTQPVASDHVMQGSPGDKHKQKKETTQPEGTTGGDQNNETALPAWSIDEKQRSMELTRPQLLATRLYGAEHPACQNNEFNFGRTWMKVQLKNSVDQAKNEGVVNYINNNMTVDKLNGRIGINSDMFAKGSLGNVRYALGLALGKSQTMKKDKEAMAWGEWLAEESRFKALMMPEMTGEVCRKNLKMDKEDNNDTEDETSAGENKIDTTGEQRNFKEIDIDNHRIIVGDANRVDRRNLDNSHLINSGIKRPVKVEVKDEKGEKSEKFEEFEVFWFQEKYSSADIMKTETDIKQHTWTPELRKIHDKLINEYDDDGSGAGMEKKYKELKTAKYNELITAYPKKYFINKDRRVEEYKNEAEEFRDDVFDKTFNWIMTAAKNRFFRLTSLMGLDFFNHQGNNILFARENNQQDYTKGRVKRVITDSEWAHANQMEYMKDEKQFRQVEKNRGDVLKVVQS